MFSFILRRLSVTIPTFLGITVLAFALIHMIPGDPVLVMVGERRLDPEFYRQALIRLGLDQPLYMQYWHYLLKVLQGDLGQSLVSHEPVIKDFWALFPATLELSICAMLLASVFGLVVGLTTP
jgi:dipeptide transport system permease protein